MDNVFIDTSPAMTEDRSSISLDRAENAVARLKLQYARMGIADGREEAIQMQAIIEKLEATLKATVGGANPVGERSGRATG